MNMSLKILAIIALLPLLLMGCDHDQNVVEEPQLRPVRYVVVKDAELASNRTMSGISQAGQEARLSFKVGGTLNQLNVHVGDQLQAGQVIATLDRALYELEVQKARAVLSQAEAGARNAKASYARARALYENRNASRNELDARRASSDSAVAQVKSARKTLEISLLNLSYSQLKATDSCHVSAVNVEVNENIHAGQDIVKVTCGNEAEVLIDVAESMIANIKKGMKVDVRFSAFAQEHFSGEVSEVGIASESGTTFAVTVHLQHRPTDFRSGLAADVSFEFPPHKQANDHPVFMLPALSVSQDDEGSFVFVVEDGGEADVGIIRRRAVSIGSLTQQGMEIYEGLVAGEKVVTAGISVIYDGLRVRATR